MACIICMDTEGTIEDKKGYYRCSCNECLFHNECFSTYTNKYNRCPICRKEKIRCLICLESDGILHNQNPYYNCECNCLFHRNCFCEYDRLHSRCPICNKKTESKYKREFILYKAFIIVHSILFTIVWMYDDIKLAVVALSLLDLLYNSYELIITKYTQRYNIFVLNNYISKYCWLFLSSYRIVSLAFIFLGITADVDQKFIVYYIFYSLFYLLCDLILILVDYFSER